jgi:hypothetical protein
MDEENAGRPPEGQGSPPDEGAEPVTGSTGGATRGPEPGAETAATAAGPEPGAETGATVAWAADGPTRVMPGDDAAATRVMPQGGPAAPPPPPKGPPPTLVMSSRPPKEGGSSTGWIVVIVILAALAAAAAAWYFLLRDQGAATPTPSPTPTVAFNWVGAWAPRDGSGGGIVVQKSDGTYQITAYDTMVQVLGSATATERGKDLTFKLDTSESLAGIPGPYEVKLSPGPGDDEASMSVTGANGTTIIMPLKRVPALVPVTPSSSPSPTTSPTPTVSPSTSPSASPSPTQSAEAQQVIDGIDRIQAGIMTWSSNSNGLYPDPADVQQDGDVAQYVDPWPTNPYDGAPMQPGTSPGGYIYQQLNGGAGYQLTGYLSGGLTYTVP